MDDNNDEAVRDQASMEWWRAKLMKEEYSEGDPVPVPPPQIPPAPVQTGDPYQIWRLWAATLLGFVAGLLACKMYWRNT